MTLKELMFVAVYNNGCRSNTDVFATPDPEYVNAVIAPAVIAVTVMTKSLAGYDPPPIVAASIVRISPST